MSGVARCRKRAQEILAQAERDPRHSRKLIAAAECWLELASCLRRLEKSLQYLRPQQKRPPRLATSFMQTGDKKESMSQSGWYHDKAAECDRMALASTNAVTRARYIKDRDNWREIAARIDAAEEAIKQRKGE